MSKSLTILGVGLVILTLLAVVVGLLPNEALMWVLQALSKVGIGPEYVKVVPSTSGVSYISILVFLGIVFLFLLGLALIIAGRKNRAGRGI